MNSRHLVFKSSRVTQFSSRRSRLCLGLFWAICLVASPSNLQAQSPIITGSNGSGSNGSSTVISQTLPPPPVLAPSQVIGQPTLEHSNQPALVQGTILPGTPVSNPSSHETDSSHDLSPAISLPSTESGRIDLMFNPVIPGIGLYPKPADEINAIRKQLGGGLSQHLKEVTGVDPQVRDSLEARFQSELSRLASEAEQRNQTQPDHRGGQADAQREYIGQPVGQPVGLATPQRYGQPFNSSPVNSGANRADLLRDAARTLDQMASQFETSGLYEEADQVRAQAQRFWLKSRFQNQGAGN